MMCRCNVYEQEQELTCSIAQVTNKASPPPPVLEGQSIIGMAVATVP